MPVLLILKMVCVVKCPVGHSCDEWAPEETINRKSPSKHARTGMVGVVPTVRCPYGLHTVKGAGHVPRPHRVPYSARTVARMGPVPICPYRSRTVFPCRSRTVLPIWAPYRFAPTGPVPLCPYRSRTVFPCRSRTVLPLTVPYCFARTGPVPFCPYGPRTVLPVPVPYRFAPTGPVPFCPYRSNIVLPVPVPYRFALTGPVPFCPHVALNTLAWSRLLAPGVLKLSCSTPFTLFWRLVSVYRSFQLYFIPKIISTIPLFYSSILTAYFYLTSHSPVFIYNTTLLCIVLLALCGHLQTQRVCRALHPVSGEDGILVAEVPRGVQHASSTRTSPRRVVGWRLRYGFRQWDAHEQWNKRPDFW